MDRNEAPCETNVKSAKADVWGYIKSQGNKFALHTLQHDTVSGDDLNFNQLVRKVESFASVLRELDLPSGIGICSENNSDYCWILLGALHAGVRCTLLSPAYSARELRHFFNLTEPDMVLCSKQVGEKLYENGESIGSICSKYSCIKSVYMWGKSEQNSKLASLSTLLDNEHHSITKKQKLYSEPYFDGSREALIFASSGTTGLPKGVVLTHQAMVESLKLSYIYATSDEPALGLMPFSHVYGLILGLMCLCEGSRLIIVPKLVSAEYLGNVIEKYQIKNLYIVPSLLAMMVKHPAFTPEKLSSLRHVWTSAGKVSRLIQEKALAIMPKNAVLHHCYGMTETTFVALTNPCEKFESAGKVVPNIECKIVRDNKKCGPDEAGELWFRGPSIMKGYLNNETATSESLQGDGWLRSGDLGYCDRDGYFFIIDRIKEMIKYQGNQVSPIEIENIILELPDVLEAAVVGLPSEDFGELPAAGIVVRTNSKLTAEEIKEHVAKQSSPHKKLRGGVFFLSELPRTSTGKVRRKELLTHIADIVCYASQDR